MNEQHGYATGDGGNATGAFDTTTFASDPLFGSLPGAYDAGQSGQWDSSQWTAAAQPGAQTYGGGATTAYDAYATQSTGVYESGSYGTGGYDTTAMWATAGYQPLGDIPAQPGPQSTEQWDTTGQWQTTGAYGYADTGTYDATAWNSAGSDTTYATETTTYQAESYQPEAFQAESYQAEAYATTEYDTNAYDAAAYETAAYDTATYETAAYDAAAYDTGSHATTSYATGSYETGDYDTGDAETGGYETTHGSGTYESGTYEATNTPYEDEAHEDAPYGESELLTDAVAAAHDEAPGDLDAPGDFEDPDGDGPVRVVAHSAPSAHTPHPRSSSRGRRRTPAKRSALLTVAVPSVCALGVAGVAAASVAGSMGGNEEPKTQAAPDPGSVETVAANNKLDTQLTRLSADADDFADRASRTQERIDLKARQEAEKKRKAEEAARREALRPKFSLPVKQHGLSAYYGQAGVNWMSVHSGIDFPVAYGTKVLAATDGTVRTQWNGAYGNMAIVTAPDGTETWYCHLSSTKIRSGTVKAGDVIAYSGNSGNSTGPHLHFEVRPAGGSAINPLTWLRNHGLDPT